MSETLTLWTRQRGDIKRYREYLNQLPGELHRNGRYRQTKRGYGDYLYFQDRERFMMELKTWIIAGRPSGMKTQYWRA